MLYDYQNPSITPRDSIEVITLYPNPGEGNAVLENKNGFSQASWYSITDIQGRIVQNITSIVKQTQVSIDLKGYANGNYFIRINHNKKGYSFNYAKTK